jgi:crotonobetainyl-CoA:carnitine CoA-transferase CaiB-like acyl-CoA transferase
VERLKNKEALWSILEERFKTRDAEDWTAALQKAQVPVGEVKTLDRALNDPQVMHRDMVVTLTDSEKRKVKAAGNPVRFNEGNRTKHRFPPPLGQDGVDILTGILKKSEAEVNRLIESGVVFTGCKSS